MCSAGMVKYGFPLASTMALMAWGMLEFPGVSTHLTASSYTHDTFGSCLLVCVTPACSL